MSVEDQDPRLSFLSGLDLSTCRVELSSSPIVLLCGGSVKTKERADDPDPPIKSLRHALTKHDSSFEFFRPEEIDSWHSDGVFKDLMSFEMELANICSLVVIVLESEGALVELGAFSQLPELSQNIIAICSSSYSEDPSFINLGVLRFIAAKNPSAVRNYPWDVCSPASISADVVRDIVDDIREELDKKHRSQVFKGDRGGHVIVLVCELLRLFTALKESEIFEYLGILGLIISKSTLRGQLFLLCEFRIIKTHQYSDAVFYMRTDEVFHGFRFSFKADAFDLLRLKTHCLEYYESNTKHRNRQRAIRDSKKGVAK